MTEGIRATNLDIDRELMNRALEVSGFRTRIEAVTVALEEFIARRAQARIVEIFGTLDWDDDYDYRAERTRQDANPAPTN